jgi:multidrug efflux pump subunit AcrA (membrane-fusion protein)
MSTARPPEGARTAGRHALADLVTDARPEAGRALEWRRQLRHLLVPMLVVAGLLAAWAAAAPLAGAVVAPAELKVEYKRKTVQHQEGGIVREIRVRDGQAVHAGDPLLVIGDLRQDADLRLLQDQWRAARLRAARAEAESRPRSAFEAPDALRLDAAAAEHLARERAVFVAHRQALDEQTTLLQAQAREALSQTAALQAQIDATLVSGALSDEELVLNEQLASQGYVSRTRLIGLQRTVTDYRSRAAEVRSDLSAARQRVAELRARAAQLRLAYQTQATDESREAAARVRELEERMRPSQDQVERQVVRAPVDGTVMSLRVAAARRGGRAARGAARRRAAARAARGRRAHRTAGHRSRACRRRGRGAPRAGRCAPRSAASGAGHLRLGRPAHAGRRRQGMVRRHRRGGRAGARRGAAGAAPAGRHAGRAVRDHGRAHAARVPRETAALVLATRAARAGLRPPARHLPAASHQHSPGAS